MARKHRIWVADRAGAGEVAQLLGEFRDSMGRNVPPGAELCENVIRILGDGDGEFLLGGADEAASVCQLRFRWSVWTSAEDCWVEDLFVRDSARRTGLGRALVEMAFERARAHGCRRIELDVDEDNGAAVALYQRCGFTLAPKGSSRSIVAGRRL